MMDKAMQNVDDGEHIAVFGGDFHQVTKNRKRERK
jgi:hypothetical protein